MYPPILLTSCVYVSDQSVALNSAEDRVKFTLESIKKWYEYIPACKIVICDNSGYDFESDIKKNFPGKQIECLNFLGDKDAVLLYGKGYGEGEIIDFAILNSKYILSANCFAKCTAKLWVSHPKFYLTNWGGRCALKPVFKNVFSIKPAMLSCIDTRFYVVSIEFYKKFFQNLHKKIKPRSAIGLEDLFMQAVISNDLTNIFWKKCPQIYGVSGASGNVYKNSLKKEFKENFRFYLMQKKSQFKNLFYSF